MELLGGYFRRARAETKAYQILCDIEASSHGFVFGEAARQRLAQIGLVGEALAKKQLQLKKDYRATKEGLIQVLMNS